MQLEYKSAIATQKSRYLHLTMHDWKSTRERYHITRFWLCLGEETKAKLLAQCHLIYYLTKSQMIY